LVCQIVGGQFFLFCQNYMDAKLVYQIVGVALSINVGILILVGVNSFILLYYGYIVLVFCIYYSVVD
jgi:hypothetical protein